MVNSVQPFLEGKQKHLHLLNLHAAGHDFRKTQTCNLLILILNCKKSWSKTKKKTFRGFY